MSLPTLELGRDPDGDISLEIYIDRRNLVSLSIGPKGQIAWAGVIDGQSEHNALQDALGAFIYRLTDAHVKSYER